MVSCFSVSRCWENARILESLVLSSRPNNASKRWACCCQSGSEVSADSGDVGAGGMPARNRAVSFAVADSTLYAGAALRLNATAIKAAAIILDIIVDITLGHRL